MANGVALALFLQGSSIETRWDGDILSAWIPPWALEDFAAIVESSLCDGGMDVTLTSMGYIWLDLVPVLERCGVNPLSINSDKK